MLKAVQEDPNKITDLLAVLDGRDPVSERERLTKLPEQQKRSLMDEDGFIDPKNLLAIIKSTGADQENKEDNPEAPTTPAFPQAFDIP